MECVLRCLASSFANPIECPIRQHARGIVNNAVKYLCARYKREQTYECRNGSCQRVGKMMLINVQHEKELDACCIDDDALEEVVAYVIWSASLLESHVLRETHSEICFPEM
jgi:hypothetical protein